MRVLRTVAEVRREQALLLFGTGFLALALGWTGLAWWLARPGQLVERALGLELPAGSRLVHSEWAEVDPESPFAAVYVSTTWTVDEAVARLTPLATEHHPAARRFLMSDGAMVVVARPEDVPATRLLPIHPVTPSAPLGTRAWIVVSRGTPPAATWSAAVPPHLGGG